MDKAKICKIRDIYRAISELDAAFCVEFGLCMNEAMVLCVLSEKERMTSSEIAEALGTTTSNASKIIRMVEDKKWIERALGKEDHRQMFFSLTERGVTKIQQLKSSEMPLPDILERVL